MTNFYRQINQTTFQKLKSSDLFEMTGDEIMNLLNQNDFEILKSQKPRNFFEMTK